MAALPAAPLLISRPVAGPVAGRWDLPGDRSSGLSALACAALALGRSRVEGLADTLEVGVFTTALRALGVGIDRTDDGAWTLQGRGVGGLAEPDCVLASGGSAAVAALLLGLVASHPVVATLGGCHGYDPLPAAFMTGLTRIGAHLALRPGRRLPGTIAGSLSPLPARHEVEGAWERAALLLAGLNIPGRTIVREDTAGARAIDGLLAHFGAVIEQGPDGTSVAGHAELTARHIGLPGDSDLACLALLAALRCPGGPLILPRVVMDRLEPTLVPALRALGADIRVTATGTRDGLSVADLCLYPARLTGATIDLQAPSLWGEALPFLLVAAGIAQGQTRVRGAASLRGRLDRLGPALYAAGIDMTWPGDELLVARGAAAAAGPVSAGGDAPLALALLAWGCGGVTPLVVSDARIVTDRYPGLIAGFNMLGGAVGLGE